MWHAFLISNIVKTPKTFLLNTYTIKVNKTKKEGNSSLPSPIYFLQKQHQHKLRQQNAGKHRERINRSVGYRRVVARNGVVGIVQRHRVGH